MILSMTPKERRLPEQLDNSRKRRIAKGAGRSVEEVNRLLKSFKQMREMVQGLKNQGLMGKAAAWKLGRDKKNAIKQQQKGLKGAKKRAKANVRRVTRDMASFRREFGGHL
jgi:signal recognition particle subunit SRP54